MSRAFNAMRSASACIALEPMGLIALGQFVDALPPEAHGFVVGGGTDWAHIERSEDFVSAVLDQSCRQPHGTLVVVPLDDPSITVGAPSGPDAIAQALERARELKAEQEHSTYAASGHRPIMSSSSTITSPASG